MLLHLFTGNSLVSAPLRLEKIYFCWNREGIKSQKDLQSRHQLTIGTELLLVLFEVLF